MDNLLLLTLTPPLLRREFLTSPSTALTDMQSDLLRRRLSSFYEGTAVIGNHCGLHNQSPDGSRSGQRSADLLPRLRAGAQDPDRQSRPISAVGRSNSPSQPGNLHRCHSGSIYHSRKRLDCADSKQHRHFVIRNALLTQFFNALYDKARLLIFVAGVYQHWRLSFSHL